LIPPPRFLRIGPRLITWRAVGAGPAAILLHGSPQSSRALAGLAHTIAAAGHCAIMPDTPGAGHSDPLQKPNLTIPDLAGALKEFVDAIGLQKFALYGTHTGAAIATAFTARHPSRVTTLILDGIAAWTPEERAAYRDTYAPPFIPAWDGSHLTWLWSRMETQSLFFPWHQQTQSTWRGVALSPPWHLHRNAMDMLDSGDAYRAIYQASLAFDPADFLPLPITPQLLTQATDVLRSHAARPPLDQLPLTLFDTQEDLHQAIVAAFSQSPGDAAPPLPAPTPFWRGTLQGAEKPRVLLHPAGASSRVFESELKTAGPIIAFDLPGHGFDESEMPGTAAEIAALIHSQCKTLGLSDYTVTGQNFGAVIAAAMTNTTPPLPPPGLAEHGALDLSPLWDGTHLLRAWRAAWRAAIFDPWYSPTPRPALAPLDPASLHAATVDFLRAGPAWQIANAIEAKET